MTFWQFLYSLNQHTAGCYDLFQSARGPTHQVLYGGNCVQAWLVALHIPGVAWIFN